MYENNHISVLCGSQMRAINVRADDGSIDLDVIDFWARKGNIVVTNDNLRVIIEAFLQARNDASD